MLLDFTEVGVSLLPWLFFGRRRGKAGVGETKPFAGGKELSVVRSTIMFSFEGSGSLRLKKPSSGPRPLTKVGPLRRGSEEDSFSPSETPGSGQACSQMRLGGWFSLGSGFRRLNGRRAADKKFKGSSSPKYYLHFFIKNVPVLGIENKTQTDVP